MRTLPRARSKRALLRQIDRKASWATSSAAVAVADDPVGERERRAAVAVVEDLECERVLAVDVSHQLLVGEPLRAERCWDPSLPPSKSTYAVGAMPDQSDRGRREAGSEAGPARLFALGAGILLSLLGVLGFFYDAGFDTGKQLAADDVAGIIVVNGWRNVIYLLSGLLALGFAPRRPAPDGGGARRLLPRLRPLGGGRDRP